MDKLADQGYAAVAGQSGEDALGALRQPAWRGYAHDHPRPIRRHDPDHLPDLSKAGRRLVDITW